MHRNVNGTLKFSTTLLKTVWKWIALESKTRSTASENPLCTILVQPRPREK
jgi:hypothetical protein